MRSAHQHAQDVNNSAPRWLIIVMLVALVVGVALLLRPERLSGTLKQFPTFSERAPSIGSFRGATKDPLLQRDAKREPSKPVSPPSPVPSKPSDTPKSPAPASKTTGSVLTSDGVDLASLTLQQAIERYSRIHQEQLDAFARDGSGRFVIIWPFGGLGNRLLPSITGFLLSLLTDRALLVNWKPRESSKPLGEMFDMKYFNWDLQSFPAILQRFDEPYCKSNPPDVDYIGEGDDIFSPSREMYSCKDFRTLWRKQVVSQTACQYILPLLLANEHIQAVLEAWGIQAAAPGDTFGRLAEYLLQPAKPIADVVESFMSRKFTAATVIGAQVRMKNIGVKDGTPTQVMFGEQSVNVLNQVSYPYERIEPRVVIVVHCVPLLYFLTPTLIDTDGHDIASGRRSDVQNSRQHHLPGHRFIRSSR
eukprot:TRINITY_DN5233_c0_g1_i1.p1 TRINITY_DN5233_c0_g1~~TRINITY_DN5233_c0_g1_i1.p1  ORF type:complete len:419 (-),score=60.95 TRINITY_DN5233_c0_g1_i1:483-1739(-)